MKAMKRQVRLEGDCDEEAEPVAIDGYRET
jgi:hypothetical protein